MAKNLDAKLDSWKNKLLDLGKRNRLLNFRQMKRSTVRFITPDTLELWGSFVQKEQPLEIPFYNDLIQERQSVFEPEIQMNFDPEIPDEIQLELAENTAPLLQEAEGEVRTNLSSGDLQKTLRNLRDKAKTATEEQGINALYLSFGFLSWSESAVSDVYYKAPLILVPVALTVESITSPYMLKLHEDEIVVNPTLIYKLQSDFGITLPEFDEDSAIEVYLNTVRELVAPNQWKVLDEVWLGLLSFLKINMYNDLMKHRNRITNNLNVRAIAGDASASNAIPSDLIDFDFDKNLEPTDIFQVVDADSSQQDAILCAKRGVSFVLQGPPGTGKSQTITNIIAECLADGKKVLFVSEKMAALDVVHRRLTASGLDDFCLVLHSHKANKKDVLAQLGSVLALAKQKVSISDEAYQRLDALQADKEKLNEYATQVHTIVTPLGKSIYEVNGVLANLEGYEEIIFSMENVRTVTATQYNRYHYLLNQFATTIGKMTDDYLTNPWNGANVSAVTNELRHDVGAKLGVLIPKVNKYISDLEMMSSDLKLEYSISYQALTQIQEILAIAKSCPSVPVNWITGNDVSPLFDEVAQCEEMKGKFVAYAEQLRTPYGVVQRFIPLAPVETLDTSVAIATQIDILQKCLSADPVFANLTISSNLDKLVAQHQQAKEMAEQIQRNTHKLLEAFDKEIFELDYRSILTRYKTEYTNFLKVFKSSYGNDKKQVRACYKTLVSKITDVMMLDTLNALKAVDEGTEWFQMNSQELASVFTGLFDMEKSDFSQIDAVLEKYQTIAQCLGILENMKQVATEWSIREDTLLTHYEFLYKGLSTKWEDVRIALSWSLQFRALVENYKLNGAFVQRVCSDNIPSKCTQYEQAIIAMKADIAIELNWYVSLFEDAQPIYHMNLPALIDKLTHCQNGLFLLEEWIDFKAARKSCVDEGLGDYIEKIDALRIDTSKIIPIFKKRFFRLWLDAILPEYPAVLNFRRRTQEGTVSEFGTLDKVQLEIAKARIRGKLINDLPSLDSFTRGVDEISVLRRELGKQRKIMPIRKLFREIPNLLLKLKPCLMMSPLSVSLFLEADAYIFDTIIFDEASQVCTENAIGAISRGKQVIIAGDSKQLPPSNFFGTSISDTDYDDDSDEDDEDYAYESILDEANLLPERTLLWHYRSRHEHLIAFSNAKIYKNNLITFPSNVDKVKDNGVEYIHVKDGRYDTGGKKGNAIEAKRVAELVFEHFKSHPRRSLGVIAFGTIQQQAIDTALREMRLAYQEFESFFKEDVDEPFFVKNLENVQGDERDTIIFSVGYAKGPRGDFRMNFGPLSKMGGERRLNVAITRAKHNVKLVGSILPTDIEVEKITTDGPKLLRAYIDFAINGMDVITNAITESDKTEHDSPFEKAVYDFLDRKDYKLGTQVGCSGYRIDMAVKHPTQSGRYVLGIECDGAAYHSARTARDRDRLRQDVLEGMGWRIYRIWSTDWIKDQVTEGQRLLEAIEDALKHYGMEEMESYQPEVGALPVEVTDFVTVDEKVVSPEDAQNPYGFGEKQKVSYAHLPRNRQGLLSLPDCIAEIISKTYPVHYDLICKEVAPLFGNQKATVKVRREIDAGLTRMKGKYIRKDDFFYPVGYTTIPVRIPNERKINHIAPEEIAEAMFTIAGKCTGATKESLCLETARAFGFQRMTSTIAEAMDVGFAVLLSNEKVEMISGKISLTP